MNNVTSSLDVSAPDDTARPLGPDSMAELFGWHKRLPSLLFSGTDDVAFQRMDDLHVVLSAEFSGMGTAELALDLIQQGLQYFHQQGKTHTHTESCERY